MMNKMQPEKAKPTPEPKAETAAPVINSSEQIDFTAFSVPLTAEDKRLYYQKASPWALLFIGLLVVVILAPTFWKLFGEVHPAVAGSIILTVVPLVIVLTVSALRNTGEAQARLRRFAARNAFTHHNSYHKPQKEAGSLFHVHATNAAIGETIEGQFAARHFWFGRYHYTLGSGKSRTTYQYDVLCAELPRQVPHVMLDSRLNKVRINPPLSGGEALALEGDFHRYFSVRVPPGYGPDALYFLTPELMQALVGLAPAYDVEFVENKLYFYRVNKNGGFKEADLREFFHVLETVAAEARDNTRRYQDARAQVAGQVALAGQRVKRAPIDLRHPSYYIPLLFAMATFIFWLVHLIF